MLKQFRQKHRGNHKHSYYKPALTDRYPALRGNVPKPCAGLAIGRTKAEQVPPFLSYFKTLSTGPAPRIETYDLHELVLPNDDGLTL